jgi:cell division protease FtsH
MEKKKRPVKKPNVPQLPKMPFSPLWIYFLLAIVMFSPFWLNSSSDVKPISWEQFDNEFLAPKAVARLEVINNQEVDVYLKPALAKDKAFKNDFSRTRSGEVNPGPQYSFTIGSVDAFVRNMNDAERDFSLAEKIPVTYKNQTNWFGNILGWLIPVFIIFLVYSFIARRMAGPGGGDASVFNFGRSTAMLVEKNKSDITFRDVAGLDEAKIEVREIIDFLVDPQTYTKLGAKIPKGVLLVGPPGTGKTLLAKAVAGEAKVPFFSISGSEFVEMFVGVGASRVRDLFKNAKAKAPCIIFIDEIDAIGRSRGKGAFLTGANDERESTLNQLLTEMDGFGTNSGVIVLAASNRGDILDAALMRPGRFDRHIYLELPNSKEREEIFKVHIKPLAVDDSIDLHFLATQTPGFSGADIANICNEAALIAARNKRDKVLLNDFIEAAERVIAGLEKKSKIILPEEKEIIAFHEAGHALVSWLLKNVDPVIKVSIIPRGKSLGASWYLPDEKQLRRESAFREQLCAALGGRAAEDLVFNEISSGALDDLERATKQAYAMVMYYGFDDKLGNISYYDSTGQTESSIQKPYSEDTGKMIDQEVRRMVNEAYVEAKELLQRNRGSLDQIASLLLEKETIYKQDLEKILGKREQPEIFNRRAKTKAV